MSLSLVAAALASAAPQAASFLGSDLRITTASQLIGKLRSKGASDASGYVAQPSQSELSGEAIYDRALSQFVADLEKLDPFTKRMSAPATLRDVEYIDVAFCPSSDAIAHVKLRYKSDAVSIERYSLLVAETARLTSAQPEESSDGASLLAIWKLADGTGIGMSWIGLPGTHVSVHYNGTPGAIECHLTYRLAKARSTR